MDEEIGAGEVAAQDGALASVMSGTIWLTADELAGRISASQAGCAGTMARWTGEGRLFALEIGGRAVYPAYAFDAAGEPLPVIRRVVQNLSGHDALGLACWFESPNAYLDGSRPREMLVTDAERVVAAAEARCHCAGKAQRSPGPP
jgi:hypothetical protein